VVPDRDRGDDGDPGYVLPAGDEGSGDTSHLKSVGASGAAVRRPLAPSAKA